MLVELQFINLLINLKDISLLTTKGLTREFFPHMKNEYDFIYNHYKQYGQVPDIDTFLKVFKNFQVIEVTESIDYLIDELFAQRSQDVIVDNYKRVKEQLEKGDREGAIRTLEEAATKVVASKPLEAVDILEDTSRYNSYVDKCNDFMKYYISTGFKELDKSLGGGIDRQNGYFVISARAGIGKTLVMMKFAAAAAMKGLNVGFYEGEMTVDKIGSRYDTITSHISNAGINHGDINISMQYKKFLEDLKNNHKGHLYVLTRDKVGSDKVTVDVLRGFVDKYNLDMLFIDQLSLLDDNHFTKQYFEQASNISKAIKNLQVQKHIPIVLACQQNRSAIEEGKMAGTENLSLSDRIGQDATEVMFISKSNDIMTFNLAKARDGCLQNELKYTVNYNTCEFTYMPTEDDKLVSGAYVAEEEPNLETSPMDMDVHFEADDLPF